MLAHYLLQTGPVKTSEVRESKCEISFNILWAGTLQHVTTF